MTHDHTYDEKGGQESWSHPTIADTIQNIIVWHAGQVDKSGVPYYKHPLAVMVRLGASATDAERHAALLHDVVEDTDISLEFLRGLGYSEEVLTMVDLLTKKASMTHRLYIFNIIGSGNVGALRVKLADMFDNSNEARLNRAPADMQEKLRSMIETRYAPAIAVIQGVLGTAADSIIGSETNIDVEVEFEDPVSEP